MRAAVLTGTDELSVRSDVTTVPIGAQDVRVRLRSAGICRTDYSAFVGIWPMQTPCVLGHEGAGELVEVGADVPGMAVGDRVILANLRGCGACFYCLRSQPFLCELNDTYEGGDRPTFRVGDADAYGMVGLGTWAEEMVVPGRNVVAFPADVPFDIASLVGCAVMTGVGMAIHTAEVTPGSTVVVIGGGGIGCAAIQGAKVAGAATILAVEPAVGKHDLLRTLGATHVVTPEGMADARAELTGGYGFDFALEAVGNESTLRAAWDAARRGGTVVIAGIGPTSASLTLDAYEASMHAKRLIGTVGGSVHAARDFPMYLDLWKQGRLDLAPIVTRTIALDEVVEALEDLRAGGEYARQVIMFDQP